MNTTLTQTERTWAAVAHASAVVTVVIGLTTGGVAALTGLLAPFIIYLMHQHKSDYIAFHALQSLAYQAAGIALTLVSAVAGGAILAAVWVVVGVLMAILVGFLLLPAAITVTVLYGGLVVVLPFALTLYAVVGSYKVYGGEDFEYRYIGTAVRRQTSQTPVADPPAGANARP